MAPARNLTERRTGVALAAAALAVAGLAACRERYGLEIDVHSKGAATVKAFVVGSACTLADNTSCTGTGVQLNGASALPGNALPPGATYEIVGSGSAEVQGDTATLILPLDVVPTTLWRLAVVGYSGRGSALKETTVSVYDQVAIDSRSAILPVDLENPQGTVDLFVTEPSPPIDPTMALPCIHETLKGQSEFYVPRNDHDCDGHMDGSADECNDQWAGSSTAAVACLGVGPAGSGSGLVSSCATGVRQCTDGSANTDGCIVSYGSASTVCFPPEVCAHCGSNTTFDPACAAAVVDSDLESTGSDVILCTINTDTVGDVCVASGQSALLIYDPLPATNCASMAGEIDAVTTSAIGPKQLSPLAAGSAQIPFAFASMNEPCAVQFGPKLSSSSVVAPNDFVLQDVMPSGEHITFPLKVVVNVSTTQVDCTTVTPSQCAMVGSFAPATVYGACTAPQ